MSSPATTGRSRGRTVSICDRGQTQALALHDAREEAAQLERLGFDDELAALGARQDQEVLDEAMEPLGFLGDVVDQPGLLLGRGDPTRLGQDLGQAEDRGDRGPELVRDDVQERLAEGTGPALVEQELVALGLEAAGLGDVLAGADHPDGLSGRVAEDPAHAVGPVDRAVRPEEPELEVERRPTGQRRVDRGLELGAIVGVDGLDVASVGRGAGGRLEPVLQEDRLGPEQGPGADVPLPEARPGRRQDELESLVASLQVRRHRADLVEGHGQSVARCAERGDERRDDGAAGEVQEEPGDVDLGQLEPGPVQPDEDRRVRDPGHDRRGQPAGQPADPCRDGDGTGQDDEARLATEGGVQRGLHEDRHRARDEADPDPGPRADGQASELGEIVARPAQRGTERPGGLASLSGGCRQRRSSVRPWPVASWIPHRSLTRA